MRVKYVNLILSSLRHAWKSTALEVNFKNPKLSSYTLIKNPKKYD